MNAVIYARVATSDQPINTQLEELRHMAAERGFQIVQEYTDKISGTKAKRPGLNQLMADAKHGKFDIVLVWACDRLARSTSHFLQIMNDLDKFGIRFLSLRENIDTVGAKGHLFLESLGIVATLEKSLGSERIKVALRRARSEGQRLGRQPLDVDRFAIVRDRLNGMSLTATAKKYGVSRASVVRFVREHQKKFAEVQPQAMANITSVECVA